jgi:hypothetical protein
LGGLENTASGQAFGDATEIQKEKNAGMNALVGGITGLAGMGMDFLSGGINAAPGQSFLSGGLGNLG